MVFGQIALLAPGKAKLILPAIREACTTNAEKEMGPGSTPGARIRRVVPGPGVA